ncbi:MAG: ketoacyl-ACP synthase III [bacterium]|nr:ketoacyl-ACP synthase III [bacterium]
MGMRIIGWGTALPEKIVTNADLEKTLDTSDEWIVERSGIRQRHIGDSTAEIAVAAGRNALALAGIAPASIDLMILATTTPDQSIPATSAHVHHELGLGGGAFDVNAACSGFVYSLVMANGLLGSGAKRILVIGAETLSNVTDWSDRKTAILFGDGGGALVLESVPDEGQLLSWDLGLDGSAREILRADHGGFIQMDGREVFKRAVRVLVDSATRALEQAKVRPDQIKLLVPHQANIRIIRAACDRLGIGHERVALVLHRTGNTSSASIPLALVDAIDHDRLEPNDLVLLTGFGAGMTWGSALIRWQDGPSPMPGAGASVDRRTDLDEREDDD